MKRSIEGDSQPGQVSRTSQVIDETFRPEQIDYEALDKLRNSKAGQYNKVIDNRYEKIIDMDRSKFEREFDELDESQLNEAELFAKERLKQEIMIREGLSEKDAEFKALAELRDDASHVRSKFDVDTEGKFLRGADGYDLGEQLDFHDL